MWFFSKLLLCIILMPEVMSILAIYKCWEWGDFFILFASLYFLKLTLNIFICVFLKLETKWLRSGEICSCEIANVATSTSGMGHGWELRGECATWAEGPIVALPAPGLICSFAGPHPQFCLFSQSWLEPGRLSYTNVTHNESEVTQSCPTLCNPMGCSLPGSLSMGFSRQEY